jgi:hypothetical protein
VLSGETTPSKNLTVRYFIDASEVSDPSIIDTKKLYDQSEMEIEGAKCTVSPLKKYKDSDSIYYVELSWEDCTIINSGKKSQFSVGFYGKGYTDPDTHKYIVYKWDPENDWSYEHLKMGKKTDFFAVDDPPEERCDYICVYADGVLVGGIEPDGTKPAEKEPAKTTTTTKPVVTTTTTTKAVTVTSTSTTTAAPKVTTTVSEENEVKVTKAGDANCDGQVDMSDIVLIMQSLANPDKYGINGSDKNHISNQGQANADVDKSSKGVTSNDALRIQEFLLGKVKSL